SDRTPDRSAGARVVLRRQPCARPASGFRPDARILFRQLVGEDLNATPALIHMDGTRLMGRWADLTGKPSPLSTSSHILQYAQENRGNLGHIGMLGLRELFLPC